MKRSDAVELICLEIKDYMDYDLPASALVAIAKQVLTRLEEAGMQPPEDITMRNCWESE